MVLFSLYFSAFSQCYVARNVERNVAQCADRFHAPEINNRVCLWRGVVRI